MMARILVIDDEKDVRVTVKEVLVRAGYEVETADNGREGIEKLRDLGADLVITDVIMPGKDGPTWVREALGERPDTRVVFVSGYAEDAFGDDQSRIPNSVFLPKPFSLNALTQTVQQQLADVRIPA